MPDSLRPHGLQPTRLLCPWDFPGKDTGVGSPFPSPGGLTNPGIKPGSSALQADSLLNELQGKLFTVSQFKKCQLHPAVGQVQMVSWALRWEGSEKTEPLPSICPQFSEGHSSCVAGSTGNVYKSGCWLLFPLRAGQRASLLPRTKLGCAVRLGQHFHSQWLRGILHVILSSWLWGFLTLEKGSLVAVVTAAVTNPGCSDSTAGSAKDRTALNSFCLRFPGGYFQVQRKTCYSK